MPTPKAAKSLLDYFNTVGGDVLGAPESVYNSIRHPYNTNVQPLQDLAAQSRQQFSTGHPVKGTLSAIESGVPVFGPMAAGIGNNIQNGEYSKALGHLTAAGGLAYALPALQEEAGSGLASSVAKRVGALRLAEQAGKDAVNTRVNSLIQELQKPDLRSEEQRAYSPKPFQRPSAPEEQAITPNERGIGPVTTDNPHNAAFPHVVPPRGLNEVQAGIYQAPKTPYLIPGQHPASSGGISRIQSLVDAYLPSQKPNYYQNLLDENPVVGTQLSDADAARIVSGPSTFPPVPYKGLHPASSGGQQFYHDIVEKMLNDMGHEDEE
jgi:hypothetical protein